MYSVDGRDQVAALPDAPQSSVGAPLPLVLAAEHRVLLAYLLEVADPAWDGTTVRVVGPETAGEPAALVEFVRPEAHFFGPPNDEAFAGHPLAARGLGPYGAFEVRHSSWVREMERRNRVHEHHRSERYARLRHFVFAFHDSTFECAAEGYRVSTHAGPLLGLLPEMRRRLTARGPAA